MNDVNDDCMCFLLSAYSSDCEVVCICYGLCMFWSRYVCCVSVEDCGQKDTSLGNVNFELALYRYYVSKVVQALPCLM